MRDYIRCTYKVQGIKEENRVRSLLSSLFEPSLVDACKLGKINKYIFHFFGIIQFVFIFIESLLHTTIKKIANEIG